MRCKTGPRLPWRECLRNWTPLCSRQSQTDTIRFASRYFTTARTWRHLLPPAFAMATKPVQHKPTFAVMISYMTLSYLLLGLIIGAISGIVGTGGGVLIVPALVYFFHMNQHKAEGTFLGALLAPVGSLLVCDGPKARNRYIKPAGRTVCG